jgi:hypothetical protein
MCKVLSVHFNMTLNLCLVFVSGGVQALVKVLAEQECLEKKENTLIYCIRI